MIRAVSILLPLLVLTACGESASDKAEVDAVAETISDDADALVAQRSAEAGTRGNEAAAKAQ